MNFFQIEPGIYINPKYIVSIYIHYASGEDEDQQHILKISTVDGEMHGFATEDRDKFDDKIMALRRLARSKFLVNNITGAITGLD